MSAVMSRVYAGMDSRRAFSFLFMFSFLFCPPAEEDIFFFFLPPGGEEIFFFFNFINPNESERFLP